MSLTSHVVSMIGTVLYRSHQNGDLRSFEELVRTNGTKERFGMWESRHRFESGLLGSDDAYEHGFCDGIRAAEAHHARRIDAPNT